MDKKKISISSHSFSNYMNLHSLSQVDVIEKAKELGFEYIEFAEIHTDESMSKQDRSKILKAECDRVGIGVNHLSVYADLVGGSDGDIDREIQRVCDELDCALILGATSFRHDVCFDFKPGDLGYFSYKDLLPRFKYACESITNYGKSRGIRTMVENHGFYFQDIDRVQDLIEAVANDNFGLLADMGNFLCTDQEPVYAMGRLAPYISYVHAKDFYYRAGDGENPGGGHMSTRSGNFIKGTIIGHGDVKVRQVLSVLKNYGYKGQIGIEFEGMEDNISALIMGLENLKSFLSSL